MKSKEEIINSECSYTYDEYGDKYLLAADVLGAMQVYADQFYTKDQMIEFGKKVRGECAEKASMIYHDGFNKNDNIVTYFQSGCDNVKPNKHSILSINIESLLQEGK